MIKNSILVVAILAAIVIGFVALSGSTSVSENLAGGTTNFDALSLSSGLSVSGGITVSGINNVVNSSTTVTLSQADLAGYAVINILASTTAASTITLPATSTLTTLIPNSGDVVSYTIVNATTTGSVHNLTIAAGTGMSLQNASTSAVLVPAKSAFLRLIRLPSTNVIAEYVPFSY